MQTYGKIIFGIDDEGKVIGIKDVDHECLKIENMINDSIDPIPNYNIEVRKEDNKSIIVVNVKKGRDTPYYYKGKAYKRADTSTIETDRFEHRRLAVEGMNMDYEEKKAYSNELSFHKFYISKDPWFPLNQSGVFII